MMNGKLVKDQTKEGLFNAATPGCPLTGSLTLPQCQYVDPSAIPSSAASVNRWCRAHRCAATAAAKSSPRPERISISDAISSPEIERARN